KPAPFGLSPKLPNQSLAPKPAPERYQTPDPQHSLEPEKAPAPKETPAPEKTPAPKQSPMSNEDGDLDSQTIAPELLKKLREREEKKNAKLPAPNGEKKNETPKPKAPPSKVGPQTQKPPTSEKKPTPPTDPATKRCAFTPGPNDTEYKPDKPDTDLETREMNKRGLNEPDSTPGNRVGFKPSQFPDCPDVINPKHPKHLPASNNTTTNDKCPADVEEWFINQERHWWPLYLPYKAMVGSFAVFATLVEPHYECFMVSSHDIDATKKFLACAQAMGDLLPLGLVGIKAARGIWRAYKSYRTVQRFRRARRIEKILELKSQGRLKELAELMKTKPQILVKETKPGRITDPRRLLGPGKDVITDPKRQLGPGRDAITDPRRLLGPGTLRRPKGVPQDWIERPSGKAGGT
ncbi:MAG: hypothetical protein KC910_36840, partial [Candidatus Eremiobacteraeota bacterium]|nr:hypothetical protein [Candidatus Eremiobacteraeota bacterium]